ncbi:MAG: hypothetical protein ACR2IJ_02535 [Fluviibacter sp.]
MRADELTEYVTQALKGDRKSYGSLIAPYIKLAPTIAEYIEAPIKPEQIAITKAIDAIMSTQNSRHAAGFIDAVLYLAIACEIATEDYEDLDRA